MKIRIGQDSSITGWGIALALLCVAACVAGLGMGVTTTAGWWLVALGGGVLVSLVVAAPMAALALLINDWHADTPVFMNCENDLCGRERPAREFVWYRSQRLCDRCFRMARLRARMTEYSPVQHSNDNTAA